MAYTFGRRPAGIETHNEGATIPYVLTGEADAVTARAYVIANTPKTFSTLYRKSVKMEHLGAGIWNADIEYATNSAAREPAAGNYNWSFDTTGQSRRITQGLQHIATYPSSGAPYNHHGAIGVTDNSVEGVDVPDKAFRWSETWQLALASYGFFYSSILGELTGRINASYFRGFPGGTVRFDGAAGAASREDQSLLEITYNFTVSPSESGMTVGSISGISKTGWDYLWVRYQQQDNATTKVTELTPVQVEVDRVSWAFNFSLLGIGTGYLS
jgi:hypothetical protein